MTPDEMFKIAAEWALKNWSSFPAALLLTGVYLKVRGFVHRLKQVEDDVDRILDVCSATHPEKSKELYKGSRKKEE